MHRTLDQLGRRPRHIPVSTDKEVSPTPRDIEWFDRIQGHGDLTSNRLHAFTEHLHRNPTRSDKRLTDLFHEAHTPHDGTYLTRPMAQFRVLRDELDTRHDKRKNHAVYRNTDRARAALRDAGRLCENVRPYSNSFEHDLVGSSITADVHLAALKEGIGFTYGHDVLNAFGLTWSFEATYDYTSPKTGKTYTNTETFRPDGMFAITYPNGGKVLYFLEVDRGNEATTSDADRKTLSHNILMYRAFIGGRQYLDYFKKAIPIVALFASTAPARMQGTMNYLDAISNDGNNYIAFRYFDDFGTRTPEGEMMFHPADIMTDILTVPWNRVSKPPITLAAPYK